VSLENWISFVRESDSDDFFNTGSTSSIGEQSRVNAVAGNYAEGIQLPHESRLPASEEHESFNVLAVSAAAETDFEIDRR
jgi:TPP-dependent 2-oxoacid decarboxylase